MNPRLERKVTEDSVQLISCWNKNRAAKSNLIMTQFPKTFFKILHPLLVLKFV
jgi:hypothetical protein